jgi:hypothetical protein
MPTGGSSAIFSDKSIQMKKPLRLMNHVLTFLFLATVLTLSTGIGWGSVKSDRS